MANSTCAKCGKSLFEIVEGEPFEANVKFNFIQCSSCGTPVGVVDLHTLAEVLRRIEGVEKKVDVLARSISQVESLVEDIPRRLR